MLEKVCGCKSAIFLILLSFLLRPLCSTTVSQKRHCHFLTKLILVTVRSFMTTHRLHSLQFTLVDKVVLSSARLLSIDWDTIF